MNGHNCAVAELAIESFAIDVLNLEDEARVWRDLAKCAMHELAACHKEIARLERTVVRLREEFRETRGREAAA